MAGEAKFRVLRPSRKKPVPGDIFALQLANGDYYFGRVILADLPRDRAPMPGAYLAYIYRERFVTKQPAMAALRRDALLIPPFFINRMPWTRGYFETVAHQDLTPDDLVSQHCFRDFTGTYFDETGAPLEGAVEPCGEWGLASYRAIDNEVSDKLGIPRATQFAG